ncbi:MAG: glycosyl hydrolase [Chthoniobacterales bacterium]
MRILLAALFILLTACEQRVATAVPPTKPLDPRGRKLVLPEHGVYTGAFVNFGDHEDDVSLEKIEAFEELVGKHQAIIASSSYWGEQTFPVANLKIIERHGAVPLVFWSPWDRPYQEDLGPDKYSLTSIIAGAHDAYIDRWADGAREFGGPMVVSFGNEANGSWFPWSGKFYGGGTAIPGTNPPQFEGPETFKRAWRHVVDRFRARGATNVQWVLHLIDYSTPRDAWNLAAQYYPGADYVDWLGFSLYGAQFPSDDGYPNFVSCFDWPYTELTRIDSTKPIMLCEWGVGEFPAIGDKGEWIRGAWQTMSQGEKYPRLKAAVFWHERWQNSANSGGAGSENEGKYSDLRANSSAGALKAYREGVASPYFIGAPAFSEAASHASASPAR